MQNPDAEIRRKKVLKAAKSTSEESRQVLVRAVCDEDPLVREWAVEGLVRTKAGTANALAALVQALGHDDRADVRWYAARAIGKLGVETEEVKASLAGALDDHDLYVRSFAAWAIGELRISDHEVVACLRGRLLSLGSRKTSLEAQSVGVALARIHTEAKSEREETSDRQIPLFDVGQSVDARGDNLPSTKEQLTRELHRTAEAIQEDQAGGRISVKRSVHVVARVVRNYAVKERLVSMRGANCQICDMTFLKKNGLHYYECHHIAPISEGAGDEDGNLLVLCANHHRQLHYAAVEWPKGRAHPSEVVINRRHYPIHWSELNLSTAPRPRQRSRRARPRRP